MAHQYSVTLRNAQANAIESTIGTAPTLEIRSGAPPTDCASADSGTLLVSITLPSDWLDAASAGAVAKAGTWTANGAANGTAGHFRIKAGATCHLQGTVGTSAADMIVSNTNIATGQPFTVNTFTITRGNA